MGKDKKRGQRALQAATIALIGALSACTSFSVLDEELPKFGGKHIDTLIAKLGMPNERTEIAGKTAYIWQTDERFTSTTPDITTSTATVGTTPITVTHYSSRSTTKTLKCRIRIFVDEEKVITHGDYKGSNGTCFRYSNRLKPKP